MAMPRASSSSDTSFEVIAPEDIRSEKLSFKDMIIRCLDRIHTIAAQMAEKNTRASMAAYEESIASLHCYLAPYYGKAYEEKTNEIMAELYGARGFKDVDRIAKLREWLAMIVKNLGRVGVLPPVDVIYDMATPQQQAEEEKQEFLKVMRKLIRNGQKDEIRMWLKFDGTLPRKQRVTVPTPAIEQVIHAAYLKRKKDGKV